MRRAVGRSWLWLVAAAAACGGNATDDAATPPAAPAPGPPALAGTFTEEGWFEDALAGFRLRVPEGWEAVEGPEGAPENVLVFAGKGSSLTLLHSPASRASLEDITTERIDELRSHCPGFQLLDSRNFFTGRGRPGKLVDFSWLADGAVVRQRQILVPAPRAVFTLTATWASGQGPDAGNDVLGPALDSFELL